MPNPTNNPIAFPAHTECATTVLPPPTLCTDTIIRPVSRYEVKGEVERMTAVHATKRKLPSPQQVYDIDEDATLGVSNQSANSQGWKVLGWDDTTDTTCPTTDDNLSSDEEPTTYEAYREEELQAATCLTIQNNQCMRLPFGGPNENKMATKWKRKIRNRNQRKYGRDEKPNRWVETYPPMPSPPTTTKFGAWLNMVKDNSVNELPNSSLIFNTKNLVNMVKFAISDSGATAHFFN